MNIEGIKKGIGIFCMVFFPVMAFSQGVTIGSSNPPDPSAVLDVQSASQGFLFPRLTTANRNAMLAPAEGLTIFNTDTKCLEMYFLTGWTSIRCECTTPPPVPVAVNGPLHACPSQSGVVYTVQPVPGAVSYTWIVPSQDTLASGQGTASIVVNFSSNTGIHVISVVAANTCGTSSSYSISVDVSNPVPVFTVVPYPVSTTAPSTFQALTNNVTYAWTFANGNPASSASQTQSVSWTNSGTYLCGLTVTDPDGCSAHLDSNITVASCQQTTQTFTNCGQTGRTGPSQGQCNAIYGPGVVTVNNGIQEWTVPVTGNYSIEVAGAQGGGSNGGLGAVMRGEFSLTQGTVLKLLVGQTGTTAIVSPTSSSSGGGGSYVTLSNNSPLIVAGGGGGNQGGNIATAHGNASTSGQTGYGPNSVGAGGTNGNGGNSSDNSGGGGGLLTNGATGSNGGPNEGGKAFVNGGFGGDPAVGNLTYPTAAGGFGGGGTGTNTGWRAGGGGGGYSGGGGGNVNMDSTNCAGGGGGSYNSGINQMNQTGIHSGHGYISITKTCP